MAFEYYVMHAEVFSKVSKVMPTVACNIFMCLLPGI
jgi:hypothetical protein